MLEISSQCLLLLCVVDYQEKVSESWLLSGWRAVEFVLSHLKDLLSYIHTHCTSQTLNSRGPCIVKTPRSEAHPLWRAMCIGEAEGLLLQNDFHASYFPNFDFFSWKDSVNLTNERRRRGNEINFELASLSLRFTPTVWIGCHLFYIGNMRS